MGDPLRTAIGHESALLAAARALAETTTCEEVARVAAGWPEQVLGARLTSFYVLRDGELVLAAYRNLSEESQQAFLRVPLGARLPVADAVRDGEPIWLEDLNAVAARYPEIGALARHRGGLEALVAVPLRIGDRNLGALCLSFSESRALDPQERTFVLGLASQCTIALDRALLFDQTVDARERMTLLAEFSASLNSSLDFETACEGAASLLLGRFADWAVVDLWADSGAPQRAVVAHADPARSRAAAKLRGLPPEAPGDSAGVLRSERAVLVREARMPEHVSSEVSRLVSELGLSSYIQAPVFARDRVHGVLSFVRARGSYGTDDLVFAEEVARRVGIAFDNAKLYARAREREEKLHYALEAGSMGAWEWDIESGRVVWSESLERIHGLRPGTFGGRLQDVCDEILKEDLPRVLSEIERVLREDKHFHFSYRVVRPDGRVAWVEAHAEVERDRDGRALRMVGVCSDITHRKRAEEELAASERRFRAVFDRALDAMVLVDDERRFVDANSAACRMLRCSKEQLLGAHLEDFIAALPPGHDIHELWRQFTDAGEERGEIELRRPDGSRVSVEYSATAGVLPGRHLAIWRDIEERRRAESRLWFLARAGTILAGTLDPESTFQAIAELTVPTIADCCAVDVLDDDGNIERVAVAHSDPARAKLARELNQRRVASADAPHGLARVIRTLESELLPELTEQILRDGLEPEAVDAVRALGLRSSICVPLVVRSKAAGAITLVTAESGRQYTVEDLRLAEELARRSSQAIDNARSYREAREANRLKDDFLATISHELRTPLNAILGWVGLLRGKLGSEPEAAARGLDVIERNALAQVRLIEDVLDVSRIVSGKLMLKLHKTDLSSVVEKALEVVAPSAEAKGVTIEHSLGNGVWISGDADRLQQVAWNLLSNAVKFTPAGGRVLVEIERVDALVVLRVTDTGQGMTAEFLPYLFDRFRQADSSPTRRHGGLGLGLAIARHLVELHGGSIHAESRGSGLGSSFTVELPARTVSTGASEPPPMLDFERPPESELLKASLRGLSVLVCDDEPDARELLANVLGERGARVSTASNAREALETLIRALPDVLVSDIAMPDEDGYSLIQRIRALPPERGSQTPALALTAFARSEDTRRALDAGYQMHLAKPARAGDVIGAVATLGALARDSRRFA